MISHSKPKHHFFTLGLIAGVSILWLIFRTGKKPSRVTYPCQKAAIGNIHIFLIALSLFIFDSIKKTQNHHWRFNIYSLRATLLLGLIILSIGATNLSYGQNAEIQSSQVVSIDLKPQEASPLANSSELFFVQNAYGPDGSLDIAFSTLVNSMESNGLFFFNTSTQPDGLIGKDDIVIIKVNCQWSERGGTNTDLVKSIIKKIVNHPEGFTGEVVVADSGQGIGSLDWNNSNAFNISQSMQDVVNGFDSHKVSTFLWDTIRTTTWEYDEGNFEDGFVFNYTVDDTVSLRCSYPKFKTQYDTYISFKNGIWSNLTSSYDSKRLKIINVPVLKSHVVYGVTGCVKHYMGIPYQQSSIYRNAHTSIRLGAMGTLMAKTRFPTLNILDATWINPNPLESGDDRGPQTAYEVAKFTNIIGSSLDPVALDYWASKHILMPAAILCNHSLVSSLDPDYEPISSGPTSPPMITSFHNYLTRSMNILKQNNHQVTMNETEMTVHVAFGGPIYNVNTGLHHGTIQEAINQAIECDTIFVRNGTYFENVIVNKSISLIGENRESTIIDGNGTGTTFHVDHDTVNISGFFIRESGIYPGASIFLDNVRDCLVSTNIIDNSNGFNATFVGIFLNASEGNNITGNVVRNNLIAINALTSSSNTFEKNYIVNAHLGMQIANSAHYNGILGNFLVNCDYGINLDHGSNNNYVYGNQIEESSEVGIAIETGSSNNLVIANGIVNNIRGIRVLWSSNNRIYHNYFVDNTIQTYVVLGYPNEWDDGYPSGGNFWSNYNGADSNTDGIGDSTYVIDDGNQDNYPLMGRLSEFKATSEYCVQTICNSTITNFQFNGSSISFTVVGGENNVGFCRVLMPKDLMNEPYHVFVNGSKILHESLTAISNSTHHYLYFTYEHSALEIIIVTEHLSLILPLLMSATLLVIWAYKKKV